MNISRQTARRLLPAGVVLAAATVLAGCMGPTYGTGTPSGQQTLEDVSGILSLGGERKEPIAYQPRGELVRPGSTEVLPSPQQSASSNEAWPESPEQRLARIRSDATDNQGNVQYQSGVRGARNTEGPMVDWDRQNNVEPTNRANQREEFNRRLAESRQGDATQRRYLSEPPTTYRQPSANAPVGDVGEDEWRKQRAQAQAQGKATWRDWIPGM